MRTTNKNDKAKPHPGLAKCGQDKGAAGIQTAECVLVFGSNTDSNDIKINPAVTPSRHSVAPKAKPMIPTTYDRLGGFFRLYFAALTLIPHALRRSVSEW